MNMTIKSKTLGRDFTFFAPDGGGYIRLEDEKNHGTLGRQICAGGDFRGSTLSCQSEDEFKSECRRWYRQHREFAEEVGLYDSF